VLSFLAAVFLLLITPGPGVLSIAGVGSGFGWRAGSGFLAGLCVGSNLVGVMVISGLAALMLSVPWLRVTLLTGSVLYLIWLAAKIAFSGSRVGFASAESAPGFMNGVTLQLINPKAYVVNTALFTGFPFWPGSLLAETLIKFAIINLLWLPIHLAWLWFGVALRRLDLPGPVQRAINLAMAASMLAVVGLAMGSQR
jgi:threonine/homoserine/homoserine lactone efflux protein